MNPSTSKLSAANPSRCLAALLLVGGLAACTPYIPAGTKTTAPEAKYLAQLHAEYRDLALREGKEGDFPDADHFANKAAQASKGTAPKPDAHTSRKLPKAAVGALKAAEARLKKALADDAAKLSPVAAARAQAMYDCWLQEQEENYQPKNIVRCRDGFLDNMDEVAAAIMAAAEAAKKKKPKKPKTAPAPRARDEHYIYFGFDVSDPEDPFNNEILNLVASLAKKHKGKLLRITGHADRAGPEKYNLALSERRAISVKAALIERGVAAGRMSVFALGEHSPAYPTPDGERSDANRRVEILIQH